MNQQEKNKAVLKGWYEEMWFPRRADKIPEFVAPVYRRHEMGGTREVTPEVYAQEAGELMKQMEFSDLQYELLADGDKVTAVGSWIANGQPWYWTQVFRIENGKLAETWLSGIVIGHDWEHPYAAFG